MRQPALLVVGLILIATQAGCVRPQATAIPTPLPGTLAPGEGECDQRSTRIELNTLSHQEMQATSSPYPANCLYYCLWVPEGGDSLEIGIVDFVADLDLFVGFGDFSSVVGIDPTPGASYDWKSNQYGTRDEAVTIPAPEIGVYYIEVCSYEGDATPFDLSTRLR
jgi:hypothetical protein